MEEVNPCTKLGAQIRLFQKVCKRNLQHLLCFFSFGKCSIIFDTEIFCLFFKLHNYLFFVLCNFNVKKIVDYTINSRSVSLFVLSPEIPDRDEVEVRN
jgi:hypothetical protein